jgi:AraC-like DNA-binding protein
VVGLRFQPGAVERWLAVPSDAFVDQRVLLEDVWGGEARRLTDDLARADTPEQIAVGLQTALGRRALALGDPDPWARELLRRVRGQVAVRGELTAELSADLGVTERTLLRRSRAAFGYGPKFLQRVMRFQTLLNALRGARSARLSAIALGAGYADQAHFSREAVELSGFTPTALIRQFHAVC